MAQSLIRTRINKNQAVPMSEAKMTGAFKLYKEGDKLCSLVNGAFDRFHLLELENIFSSSDEIKVDMTETDGKFGRYVKISWIDYGCEQMDNTININLSDKGWLSEYFSSYIAGEKKIVKGNGLGIIPMMSTLKSLLHLKRSLNLVVLPVQDALKLLNFRTDVVAKEVSEHPVEFKTDDPTKKKALENWPMNKVPLSVPRIEIVDAEDLEPLAMIPIVNRHVPLNKVHERIDLDIEMRTIILHKLMYDMSESISPRYQ
jgi:hypothetical protein